MSNRSRAELCRRILEVKGFVVNGEIASSKIAALISDT